MLQCCTIEEHARSTEDTCDMQILAGFKDLRITTLCQIDSVTKAAAPGVLVTDITMATIAATVQSFYYIETKESSLNHVFLHEANEETGNKSFKQTVSGEVILKSEDVFYALNKYLGKEVVVIGKEPGADGRWRIIGIGGGLIFLRMEGKTGLKKSDNSNTVITIEGETGEPWYYVWDTDAATTETLIDSLTAA
jgi:hypothetical protein